MNTHRLLTSALTLANRESGFEKAETLARFIDTFTGKPVSWEVSASRFLHTGSAATALDALHAAEDCCEGLDLPRVTFGDSED